MIKLNMEDGIIQIHKLYCEKYLIEKINNICETKNVKKLRNKKTKEILAEISSDTEIKSIIMEITISDNYYRLIELEQELGGKLVEYQKKKLTINQYFSNKVFENSFLSKREKKEFIDNYSYENYKNDCDLLKKNKKKNLISSIFPVLFYFEDIFLKMYNSFSSKNEDKVKKIELLKKEIITLENKEDVYDIINAHLSGDQLKNWSAYLFTFLLDVSVCPYCNSQYIFTYIGENKNGESGGIRPELDHCFPKSKNPFLAISLYNLVPSCSQCNGSIKSNKDIKLDSVVNLYTEDISDKFEFYIEGDSLALLGKSYDYSIKYRVLTHNLEEKKRIENFLDSFHLESRYIFLKKYISEQIVLRRSHSTIFLQGLNQSFNLSSSNEIYEEGNNRFLGKILNDIINI